MKKIAIYSGTFDPITIGHLDILKKSLDIFDEVIVAVAQNERKKPMFSFEDRVLLVKVATKDIVGVKVVGFNNLLIEFAKKNGAKFIIRGLRAVSDFEYELQMAYANKTLCHEIETIFLVPDIKNSFISSSVVRELIRYNGDFSHLVTNEVFNNIVRVLNVNR